MRSDLPPLSLGDIFDEAFDLYKRNFALLAGIAAIAQVPARIGLSAATHASGVERFGESRNFDADMGALALFFVAALVYSIVFLVESGALTIAISERYLGRPITIAVAWRHALRNFFRLFWTWFFVACLLCMGAFAVFMVSVTMLGVFAAALGAAGPSTGSEASPIFVFFGVVAILLPVFGMFCCYAVFGSFISQIVVIERTAYFQAIGRNWYLVQARFLRSVIATMMIAVFSGGMLLTLQVFLQWMLELLLYSWLPASALTREIVQYAWIGLVATFLQPFWMAVLTVLYYDQRVRREGFDLALRIHHMTAAQAPEAAR